MKQITSTLPLVALRGLTVVPSMIMHFDLNRDMSKKAVEQALNKTQKVLLVPQIDPEEEKPEKDGLYKVCTVANIRQVTKLPNDIDRVMVEAVARAHILELDSILVHLMRKLMTAKKNYCSRRRRRWYAPSRKYLIRMSDSIPK